MLVVCLCHEHIDVSIDFAWHTEQELQSNQRVQSGLST